MANNPSFVSPDAAELLEIMADEIRLPEDWDLSGFWLTHAQMLAEFMAEQRGKFSLDDAAMLAGIGGMLVEMARREREASAAMGAYLRGEGGEP